MTKRAVALAVCVAAIAVALAACSSGGGGATGLRDGFVVARNSHLVGATFGDASGWSAVIDIERDPVGVYDDYAAQARKLGVVLPSSGAHRILGPTGCTPKPGPQSALPKQDRCYDGGSACFVSRHVFTCEASAVGPPPARLAVNIELAWGGETRHMQLGVSPGVPARLETDRASTTTAHYAGPIPASRERPPLTTAGRPFGSENDASGKGNRRFTLEAGSRVIADAPALNFAVLEITGDAQRVLSRYAEQVVAPEDQPAKVEVRRSPGGGTYLSFSYSPEGGGGSTWSTDASRKYVRVSWSSD